jgi:DNA-binding FadR family transcriptional regulator
LAISRITAVEVRRHVEGILASGDVAAGGRLPTERELARRLGASRNTVRDALNILEGEGLVLRVGGSGTYAAERSSRGAEDWSPRLASPAEIMEARLVFEPRLTRVAAVNATSDDLDRLSGLDREARDHVGSDQFERLDAALHAAIAAAAHNRLLLGLYDQITLARDQMAWGRLKKRSGTPENRLVYAAEHAAIVAALRMRDPDQAEEAALAHLRTVKRHMLGD